VADRHPKSALEPVVGSDAVPGVTGSFTVAFGRLDRGDSDRPIPFERLLCGFTVEAIVVRGEDRVEIRLTTGDRLWNGHRGLVVAPDPRTRVAAVLDETQADLEAKATRIADQQETIDALESDLDAKDARIEDQQDRIHRLESKVDYRDDRINELQSRLEKLEAHVGMDGADAEVSADD